MAISQAIAIGHGATSPALCKSIQILAYNPPTAHLAHNSLKTTTASEISLVLAHTIMEEPSAIRIYNMYFAEFFRVHVT